MTRRFAATFGFRPPSAAERAALDRVRAYLRRVECELGSRGLAGSPVGPMTSGSAATREALRASVQAAAAFCDGLLDAAEPEIEAGLRRAPVTAPAPGGLQGTRA